MINCLNCVSNLSIDWVKVFEIVARTSARFLYSFLDMIFLHVDVLEREYMNLGFRKFVKSVSPTCFKIEAQTHESIPYSFFKADGWSFWIGETKYESWKYCGIIELSFFFWDSSMACTASILFSSLDFSSISGSRKGV